MPRFRFVPNLTHQFPSKDHLYRTKYYPYFERNRDPRDLSFEGYFRAICIYGGEEELLRNGKVARSAITNLLKNDPAWANNYRRQAVQLGYSDPERSQIQFTIFWSRNYFDTSEDVNVARQVYAENPQPNIVFTKGHETLPVLENWPACPIPWSPAPVPGARTANLAPQTSIPEEDSDLSADAQDSSYESDFSENSQEEDDDVPSMAPTPTGNRTPGSARLRNSRGQYTKEEDINHLLAVVESIYKATADFTNKDLDQKKYHDVLMSLIKKNPNVPEKLRESLLGKDIQEMNAEEYSAALMQSAKASGSKKRRFNEIDDTPVGRGVLFPSTPQTAAADKTAEAPSASNAALEKIKEKDRLLDWQRHLNNTFRDNIASLRTRIEPDFFYLLPWGADLHLVTLDFQGVIHYKLVAATLHKILSTLQDTKSLVIDFSLLSLIDLLKSNALVAEFSVRRAKENKLRFACDADDEELMKEVREQNIAEESWMLFASFSFGQTKGYQALRRAAADDVLAWAAINKSRDDFIEFLEITDEEYDDGIAAASSRAKPKMFTTPKK